jgi:MFS superfamily sulfate permease-like transporter
MSLFLLALELTLPPAAAVLSLGSARDVLFNSQHITLLIASFLPALFLSVSIRLQSLARVSSGFTQHALYVPVYMFVIVGVFWISVAGRGSANASGINHLANQGWLFTVRTSTTYDTINAQPWNYWTYFNFSMVRWSAMSNALQDIILLVVIGVLNLPIYIPAMALALDVPVYNMNHELLGHGISNILAGAVGTVPNLVVCFHSPIYKAKLTSTSGLLVHSILYTCRRRPF